MFFEKKGQLFIGRFAGLYRNYIINHGFSTRGGGVSPSPYKSLNLGENTGDNQNYIDRNRERYFHALDFLPDQLAIPEQVHNDHVLCIQNSGVYPETDGLLTNQPELILSIQVADCLALFLLDPVSGAIGLIHAGWRGSSKQIAKKSLLMMQEAYHSNPKTIQVYLAPAIGPCCYSVGPAVANRFASKYLNHGKLDLLQINIDQLLDSGVKTENIDASHICTACHSELFFSHRLSNGKTGRMMGILGIREKKLDIQ